MAGALLAASVLAPLAAGAGSATRLDAASSASASSASSASLSAWRGGVDLYRPGVFTTQKTWYWCTAATVQISRNIVFHQADHSASGQRAYFDWMRQRNRYRLPLSAGVDAAGWTAGFAHFVDRRYRLFASATFDAALRSAVANLRKTNLPVALAVDHGNHAWLLTGFTATADPARTSRFSVTSVRVVGPLYGLQSKDGYDMAPDTRLTPAQLRRYFTPWYYAPIRMAWDGTYVSIQAVAAASTATLKPSASPTATPRSSAAPSTLPTDPRTAAPTPTSTAPTATLLAAPTPSASLRPLSSTSVSDPAAAWAVAASAGFAAASSPAGAAASPPAPDQAASVAGALDSVGAVPLVAVGALVAVVVAVLTRRRRTRPS